MPRRPLPGSRSFDRHGWSQAPSRLALGYLLLRFGMSLSRRLLEPRHTQRIGLLRASAPEEGHAEAVLGLAIALLGGAAEPVHGFDFVLVHAFAARVPVAELGLGGNVALLRGLAVPEGRVLVAPAHPARILVTLGQHHPGGLV